MKTHGKLLPRLRNEELRRTWDGITAGGPYPLRKGGHSDDIIPKCFDAERWNDLRQTLFCYGKW